MSDETVRKFAKQFVESEQEAFEKFKTLVIEKIACDDATATHIFGVYKALKVIKFDHIHRTYRVKHGGVWDDEVLFRAAKGRVVKGKFIEG